MGRYDTESPHELFIPTNAEPFLSSFHTNQLRSDTFEHIDSRSQKTNAHALDLA